MESFLISDDLHSNQNPSLVINTAYHLTKTALPQKVDDFISIGEMIAFNDVIVTSIVIVAKVS